GRALILRRQLQLFLSLHVPLSPQDAQVSAVHRQQHHGAREELITHISDALPAEHDRSVKTCEELDLSVALYKHLLQEEASGCDFPKRKLYLLGFDLDQDLIHRAQNSNPFPQNIQFIPLDITDDAKSQAVLESYLGSFGCPRFHLCTCFAVTMWVHLNHGDATFLSLLSRLASLCEYLLLEAQPWKCYRSAARRLRKLGRSDFDHFKTLEIRGDMAAHAREHLEKQCSMELMQSFGNTTWDRSLLLFRRR
uniref:RNA methyltransferase n=1 Tax=Sinocyclocheilus rhinocerous TaxID=307959 RepID=A0A673MHQ3_9TELE